MNRGMSELNNIEIKLLSRLERRSEETVENLMDEIYNECCMIGKLDYSQGYGFGSEGIKEYIISMLLIDLIEEEDEKYFSGSLMLLIKGIWGCLDYAKVMKHVSREKVGVSSETWHVALNLVEERFSNLLNSDLATKKVKEPVYLDIGMTEKLSVLENLQEDESFHDRLDKIAEESGLQDNLEDKKKIELLDKETQHEEIQYDDEQISLVNYHIEENTKKKKKSLIGNSSINCIVTDFCLY